MARLKRFLTIAVVLAAVGFAVTQVWHKYRFGNFFWYGMHLDVAKGTADVAIPGVQTYYQAYLHNVRFGTYSIQGVQTPMGYPYDGAVLFRFAVEKKDKQEHWVLFRDFSPGAQPNATIQVRPGRSLMVVEPIWLAAAEGLSKGDQVRFRLLLSPSRSDLLSSALVLSEQAESHTPALRIH